MTINEGSNPILELTDSVTARRCAIRLGPGDVGVPWEAILERYLKDAPIERLLEEDRRTPGSARSLSAIQFWTSTSFGRRATVAPWA